jgi:hypothetical protein
VLFLLCFSQEKKKLLELFFLFSIPKAIGFGFQPDLTLLGPPGLPNIFNFIFLSL